MTDQSRGPGWWQASDDQWYPPETHPDSQPQAAPRPPLPQGPPLQGPLAPASSVRTTHEKMILGGSAAVAIGAFMPWASVGPFTVNGTDGDGMITLVLAVAAGWLTWARKAPTLVGVLLLFAAAIGLYDMADVSRLSGDSGLFTVSIGSGLVVTVVGAVVALVGWVKRRRAG